MERYVQSTLPIGVSLSGGIDTRQIMAYIDGRRFRIPCYTSVECIAIALMRRLARQVAAACGQSHQVLRLKKDFLSSFPALSQDTIYISDGCLSACDAYELYLNKLARQRRTCKINR